MRTPCAPAYSPHIPHKLSTPILRSIMRTVRSMRFVLIFLKFYYIILFANDIDNDNDNDNDYDKDNDNDNDNNNDNDNDNDYDNDNDNDNDKDKD